MSTPELVTLTVDGLYEYVERALRAQIAYLRDRDYVVFNGRPDQYVGEPLRVSVGDRVRFYVVSAGPSHPCSFHVVGEQFETVYLGAPPGSAIQGVQTFASSAPVTTAMTPGAALAASVSIDTMRACACGERTKATWPMRGGTVSLTGNGQCMRASYVADQLARGVQPWPDVLLEVGTPHPPGPLSLFQDSLEAVVKRVAAVTSLEGFTRKVSGARGVAERWDTVRGKAPSA